jgi:addiction module HigA family antidote
MAKQSLSSPSAVLRKLMEDYDLNPSKLAAAISFNQATLRLIILGKGKISCLLALRLAKFFGSTPEYWLTLQNQYDISEAAKDKELTAVLKGIKKATKAASVKKEAKTASPKKQGAAKTTAKAVKAGKTAKTPSKTAKADVKAKPAAKKAAVAEKPAMKKMAAAKKAATPKPAGAKRGRKPAAAKAASSASASQEPGQTPDTFPVFPFFETEGSGE